MCLRGGSFFFLIVNKQLKNVNKFWKIEKNYRLSNAFWLYQLRVRNAQFLSYSPQKRGILIWVTLQKEFSILEILDIFVFFRSSLLTVTTGNQFCIGGFLMAFQMPVYFQSFRIFFLAFLQFYSQGNPKMISYFIFLAYSWVLLHSVHQVEIGKYED